MFYRLSISNQIEISPLFVELKELHLCDENKYDCWLEKARWIRFEEHAENVEGRWSKPYVTTILSASINQLIDHILNGFMIFDIKDVQSIKQVANCMGNFFDDKLFKNKFIDLICLPHRHHHEKKIFKSLSGSNLKANTFKFNKDMQTIDRVPSLPQLDNNNIFEENKRFKKKLSNKAEGAAVLVMPVDFVTETRLIFMRLHAATELDTFLEVNILTRFVVLILGPIERRIQLFECGRAFSSCMADDVCRELFYSARNKLDIIEAVNKFKNDTMLIPPSEWFPTIRINPPERYLSKEDREKNPELTEFIHVEENISIHAETDSTLKNSMTPFWGLIDDIKRKIVFYKSDLIDGLNLKCVASILYMYLVTLCSLVTFGGLLGQETDDSMATVECILAGSICGIIFSFFSAQPLLIITATGPVFILETIIKHICDTHHLDFFEFRLWVGLWAVLILFLMVMFNLSFLVKFITRFSEECFAGLVSIVFIIDALTMTARLKKPIKKPLNLKILMSINHSFLKTNISTNIECSTINENDKTVFYFSILLFIMTVSMCTLVGKIKTKPYLTTKIRGIISDFDVLITVLVVSIFDKYVGYSTLKLKIPSQFKPSSRENWLVPFYSGQNQWYTIFMALIPAILLAILIFFDQQITAVITNRKEMKLKKSHGYHLDLLVVSVCLAICSFLGLPWYAAGTVLTITHINSLKVVTENTAPGEKAMYTGICEQRCTSLVMSVLIGLSVFLTNFLAYIPVASLYGVFMIMGINLIKNLQFFERLLILFMPAKHQPDKTYLRHISTSRVNLFTIIQLVSTLILYLVKYVESIALLFPILVVATCGIRKIMDFIFTQPELYLLDDILPAKKTTKMNKMMHMYENDPTIKFIDSNSRKMSNKSGLVENLARDSIT